MNHSWNRADGRGTFHHQERWRTELQLCFIFSSPKRDAKNKALLCADIVTHVAHLPLCVTRGCQEREGEKKNNSKVRKQWTLSS